MQKAVKTVDYEFALVPEMLAKEVLRCPLDRDRVRQ